MLNQFLLKLKSYAGYLRNTIFLIAAATLLGAGEINAQLDLLFFKKLTAEDGLSQNTISCLYQDSYGFIWIGTDNGLNRFDGYEVKVYRRNEDDIFSLSGNWVTKIIEDDDKNLWILTYDGLNKFDRGKEIFIRYTFNPKDSASVPGKKFHAAFTDSKKNLWFSTSNGLCIYNKVKNNFKRLFYDPAADSSEANYFTHFAEDKLGYLWATSKNKCTRINTADFSFTQFILSTTRESIPYSILCDSDNDMWFTTDADRLFKFDRNKNSFEEFQLPLEKELTTDGYSNIVEGENKQLWFGATFGIIRFDKKTTQLKTYKGKDAPKVVNSLMFREGKLYIATNYGLYHFDTRAEKFTRYLKNEADPFSLSDNQIHSFYTDRNKSIWFYTARGGANKIIEPFFKLVRGSNSTLNSKIIYGIYEDREGNVWFETLQDGVNKLDAKTGEIENFTPDARNPFAIQSGFLNTVFHDRTGKYWIGSRDKGISNFDPSTKKFIPHKNSSQSLKKFATRSFFEDSFGTLWIGTRGGGLNKYDRANDRFIEYIFGKQENLLNQILTMHEDREKNFWFGTDAGLVLFNRRDGSISVQKFENKKYPVHSLNSIFDIYEDKFGALWLTTYGGGFIRYDKRNKSYKIFTEVDGLLNNYVYNILEDDAGYFWLNTYRGLSRFDPITHEFLNFTKEDGLPSYELKADGAAKLRNGFLVFGSANGAFFFEPALLTKRRTTNDLGITAFRTVNGGGEAKIDLYLRKEISLSHDSYLITIDYAAFDFDEPQRINYAYKLEGLDNDWNFVGKRREAIFTSLPPGKYIFKVTSYDKQKNLNENYASISFSISAPYWKMWWFRTLMICAIASIIFAFVRIKILNVRKVEEAKAAEKIRAVEHEKRMKEELSRDLHDEVNSELTAVINNCALLSEEKILDENVQNRITKIANLSEQLRNVIHDVIWFIKPENEQNEKLIGKFYDAPKKLLADFDYEIEIDEEFLMSLELSVDFKKQLFMIYKEALQNCVKYACAENISISIQRFEDNKLIMEISDDGVGYDISRVKTGNGLMHFYERASSIDAELIIESRTGEGTSVVLITEKVTEGMRELINN